jgi:hypothetical protein
MTLASTQLKQRVNEKPYALLPPHLTAVLLARLGIFFVERRMKLPVLCFR